MTSPQSTAAALAQRALAERVITRIWERDPSAWGLSPETPEGRAIATRLGWLDVHRTMAPEIQRIEQLAEDARRERVEAVILVASRDASSGPAALWNLFRKTEGAPELRFVYSSEDGSAAGATVVPDASRTWFIVCGKRGLTPAARTSEMRFREQVAAAAGAKAGRQFIALTDPGTDLQQLATASGYREVLLNPPDVGERFSVLSLYGLAPAALMGLSPRQLLSASGAMAEGCRQENHANAGLELGAFLAASLRQGHGTLRLALAPSLSPLGRWIAQLVRWLRGPTGTYLTVEPAEAGGAGSPAVVAISSDRDEPDQTRLDGIERHGVQVMRLSTRMDGVGAEFFRWQFATAVAGALLATDPFVEPAGT